MKRRETLRQKLVILVVLLLTASTGLLAQNADTEKSIFDIMNYKEVLQLRLEIDVESLQNERRIEEYRKGVLTFEDVEGIEQRWNVKAKPRGNFRRMLCEMTPLKIKWKKADLAAAGLADFNDVKLVTSCLENKWEAKELLAKEYLAYKMYNELTPNSFRVQFVKIIYVDVNSGKKSRRWGFLIEDTAQLAARMQAKKVEGFNFPRNIFHRNSLKLTALFQYVIGNEDWNLRHQRNVKFFEKNGKIIPVPYDFDFSGLVSAPYALPNTDYGLKSVKDRIYLGFELNASELHSMVAYFGRKQDDFEEIIDTNSLLLSEDKDVLKAYLAAYFAHEDEIQFFLGGVVASK